MPTEPGEQLFTRSRSKVSQVVAGETLIVTTKKPYQEPAFRHERVFETMALSCGKINPTELLCRLKKMSS
jgi:hypothetical protein